jgi:hypothetical protein
MRKKQPAKPVEQPQAENPAVEKTPGQQGLEYLAQFCNDQLPSLPVSSRGPVSAQLQLAINAIVTELAPATTPAP